MSASSWVWPAVLAAGLVLLAVGLVLLHRSSRPSAPRADAAPGRTSSARAVLDERLARGEIDPTEHARRAAVLDEQ